MGASPIHFFANSWQSRRRLEAAPNFWPAHDLVGHAGTSSKQPHIMYVMLCTRPHVCLAISLAGRYQSNPGVDHWKTVKNILKYLKRTKDMFHVYGDDEELVVKGYVDASFDTDPDDSKSQTGHIFILNGGEVSWFINKQRVVAGSTCEAEYIAASEATQ